MSESKRFWVSWIHPNDGDYRPIHFPPNRAILGWWCSGYSSDDCAILVAWVEAVDIISAKNIIYEDWPEQNGREWRFFRNMGHEETPGDRFPIPAWSPVRSKEGGVKG